MHRGACCFQGTSRGKKRKKDVREQFVYVNQFIARRPLGTRPAPLRLRAPPRGPHQQKWGFTNNPKDRSVKWQWSSETRNCCRSTFYILYNIANRTSQQKIFSNCPMFIISTSFWYVQRNQDSACRISEMHSNYTQNNLNYERGMQFNLYLSLSNPILKVPTRIRVWKRNTAPWRPRVAAQTTFKTYEGVGAASEFLLRSNISILKSVPVSRGLLDTHADTLTILLAQIQAGESPRALDWHASRSTAGKKHCLTIKSGACFAV